MKLYNNIIFDLFDTLILFKPKEFLPEIVIDGKKHYSTAKDVFQKFKDIYDVIDFKIFYKYFLKSYKEFQELKNIDNREYPNSKRFIIMLDYMNLEYNTDILDSLVISHMDSLEQSMIFPEIHRKVLEYLKSKSYNLSILSNFDYSPTAHKLLEKYNITHYFDRILISDNIGWRKPDKKIFEFALNQINDPKSKTIFIGDDLERDIQGANNIGIDSIFINLKYTCTEFANYTVSVNCLNEITHFL